MKSLLIGVLLLLPSLVLAEAGIVLEKGFIVIDVKTKEFSFCGIRPLSQENHKLSDQGLLLQCLVVKQEEVQKLSVPCLGVSTEKGPALICGEDYKQIEDQSNSI